ncbi:MAG TPA: hypothetical protein PKK26_07840 [Candidatus Wallbacteria bacterium]|nr:hypothetical protein [Candidatus Wallbacteria bacterium]
MPLYILGINFVSITDPKGGYSGEGIGIWIAAILTIGIYSFLYKDNFLYKFAEYLFVGVSAGYLTAVSYHQSLVPSLIAPLQTLSRDFYHIITGASAEISDPSLLVWQKELVANKFGTEFSFIAFFSLKILFLYILPCWIGLMMVARVVPNITWVSKYPLAVIVGYASGIVIVTTLQASILEQIRASFISLAPLFSAGWNFDTLLPCINNIIMVICLCCAIIYFYFSAEHKGIILGTASRLGIWTLMITFGASFGYTIMARISLLISRFQFLLGDWMQLISK